MGFLQSLNIKLPVGVVYREARFLYPLPIIRCHHGRLCKMGDGTMAILWDFGNKTVFVHDHLGIFGFR